MIDILTRNINGDWLAEMHRLRHRVFAERLCWQVTSFDGMEIDPFDALDPIYLIAAGPSGTVRGSWRLVPTTGPYMLKDVFPELLDGTLPPRRHDVWEASRFCVEADPGADDRSGGVNRMTHELFCGLVEHCIAVGINEVITVYDNRIARLLPRIGCRPKWQSAYKRIGSCIALAGQFETTPPVLRALRASGGISGSVVRTAPWLKRVA